MQRDENTLSSPSEPLFNPFDVTTYANLPAWMTYLREYDPVHWLPELQLWCLSRYDDALSVFTDEDFATRGGWRNMLETAYENSHIGDLLFLTDPPEHTRLRALVNKAFSHRIVERLRTHAGQVCTTLLAEAREKGRCDMVSDYAWRIPLAVLSPLFALPAEDRRLLEGWALDFFLSSDVGNPELLAAGKAAFKDMYAYFETLIEEHRAHPTEAFIDDLIAVQEQGDALSPHELVMMAMQLVIGGYDTTANLIASGIYCLLTSRENWEMLCADQSLVGQAVEETLRYEPPTPLPLRQAVRDVTRHGKTIHAGDFVNSLVAAANRDPQKFEQPERFDITRTKIPHLTFGRGDRSCFGAPLARLDATVALRVLTETFPKLELEEKEPVWRPNYLFHGLERLPVILHS